MTNPNYNEIHEHHIAIYDKLANEYDARVSTLVNVTSASLNHFMPYLNGKRILDVGCGAGGVMEIMNQQGYEADGIELAPKMAVVAQRRNPDSTVYVRDLLELEVDKPYDGLVAFAFIHLFPKEIVGSVFKKLNDLLTSDGVMLIGSTSEKESSEGFDAKLDYEDAPTRYRKRWTKPEIENAFTEYGFIILDLEEYHDPFGKIWLDYIVKKEI